MRLIVNVDYGFIPIRSVGIGINYGQIANNLPAPSRVAALLDSLNITRVKLYDADPIVLSAFSNSSAVEFTITIGNQYLQSMSDPAQARSWIQQNVQPHVSQIRSITVGNEVLTGNDTSAMQSLVPAMQNVYAALGSVDLARQIDVTTAHSTGILNVSFPPSAGAFREDLLDYLINILDFHAQTGTPFMINAYPFFAYESDPQQIPLSYVLFEANPGNTDPATNLHYDNMLYAQIDAVYAAIRREGHDDVAVKVSETGWPSKGDPDEIGASPENAQLYNGNLLSRVEMNQGTPAKPGTPVDVFIFALFNEDLKPGPTSERNYGLFFPNGTPAYNIGLQGSIPQMHFSRSHKHVLLFYNFVLLPIVLSVICFS
ncbi:hypothetical protein M569_00087 [Genlisea aurea]|uniref:glucan endo-1,3-beta-D-glucosidase n=1 Tax=Genlisea aurea TaxID=192259 RepID=S8D4I0_9LAMI|nr:hypothetical protein M569_00087 [Genlisea aurea]